MYKKLNNFKNRKKTVHYIIIATVSCLLLLSVFMGISVQKKLSYKYYYNGINIDGIKISGLSKVQAKKILQYEFSKKYYSKVISLLYDKKMWKIPIESINYQFDFDATLNYAYNIGHEGGIVERLRTIKSLENCPINLIVAGKYDDSSIIEKLEIIKKEIDFPGISSTYKYNCGNISYTKDAEGRNFDIVTNTKLIKAQLLNRNFDNIFLIVQAIKPSISIADVKDIKDVLASYTTRFNMSNYNRAHNIALACQKINNYLLKPGEEFSMDLALGPRTAELGFMQAPIIMKSGLIPGTGGGVCQVSSTLYNAVLLSMLQVTCRVNHSIVLGYVPPGQDATIAEGYIDLKFKNNRDYTICIVSEINEGNITVKIIGEKRNEDPVVVLRPIILAEYEPPYPEYVINESLLDYEIIIKVNEKKGLKVVLYRDIYNKQGALINSEKISQDIYKPVRGVLAVNRKNFESFKKADN
ncbi:MAG TPA: VanW family protein [Ruminiclostridium sp.]